MKKTESHPPQQISGIRIILGQKQMYLRSKSIAKEYVSLKGQKKTENTPVTGIETKP